MIREKLGREEEGRGRREQFDCRDEGRGRETRWREPIAPQRQEKGGAERNGGEDRSHRSDKGRER
eukprot:1779978-Pleurochrysis_carterae.AAC.1